MAFTKLESDTVSEGCQLARKLLHDIKPVLDRLNILYDSAGGLKETITQEDLDSVPSFSDLTKAQLDDGMFVLTATLRTALTDGLTQLAHIAARGN